MNDKFWEELLKWSIPIYIFVLSIWAGTAHTIRRVRRKEIPYFSIREWVGDVVISSLIGIITFYLCKYAKVDETLTAACVATLSHIGTRLLIVFEQAFIERIGKIVDAILRRIFGDMDRDKKDK